MQQQTGSARSYELLLIAVIAARATSFIFQQNDFGKPCAF